MSAAGLVMEGTRNGLSEAILNVLRSWPTLHRQVFTQSHYYGESAESISCSLGLSVADVRSILEQCNWKLQLALKAFRRGGLNALRSADGCNPGLATNDYLC